MKLSRKQIAVVHVARRELGLGEDEYRDILRRLAGVDSAADLTEIGFLKVMHHMAKCGFRSTWTKRTFGARPGMATPSQVDLIRRLWGEWSDAGETGLQAWLERFHGISALRFVDGDKAGAVITALKAMVKRKKSIAAANSADHGAQKSK